MLFSSYLDACSTTVWLLAASVRRLGQLGRQATAGTHMIQGRFCGLPVQTTAQYRLSLFAAIYLAHVLPCLFLKHEFTTLDVIYICIRIIQLL